MNIKIYSTPACHYCREAKELIKSKGFQYEEIDLTAPENVDIKNEVLETTGQRKVPIIKIGDQYVVGFDNLVEFFKKASI